MRKNPKITNVCSVARSQVFNVETMDVEFSNGEKRVYERLKPGGNEIGRAHV